MNFGDPRLPERFWNKVQPCPMSGCWIWTGATTKADDGYGRCVGGAPGALVCAHRYAYEALVAPIDIGMELDHLCKIKLCCNPDHLEPVDRRENVVRSSMPERTRSRCAAITHCPRGHEYTPENTRISTCRGYQTRHCRTCGRLENAERARQRKAARHAARYATSVLAFDVE